MSFIKYNFLKVNKGKSVFASVALELNKVEAKSSITYELNALRQKWIDAAISGIVSTLNYLSLNANVVIKDIETSECDTTEDAVCCAASIAVWKALGNEKDIGVKFTDRWIITFPL